MLNLASKCAPTEAAFDMVRGAGFRNVELWLDAQLVAHWTTLVPLARSYPLGYALHCPVSSSLSQKNLEHLVELYRGVSSRCLVVHQPQYDRYRDMLQQLEPDIALAVENHVLDPAGFAHWAEANSGLALDVEHFWWFTWVNAPLDVMLKHLREFLQSWHEKLKHVHLPGYVPGYPQHRPMYCAREMIFAVLSLLAEFQFEGLVVSEVDLEYQTPNDLRMDVLLFETWQGLTGTLTGPG